MKILIAVGPAYGILNHTLALAELLKSCGHEVSILTGPSGADYMRSLDSQFHVTYLTSHDVNFRRGQANRLPHLHQVCDYDFLKASLGDELAIIRSQAPDLLITKHFYSIPIASAVTGVPFATYYTDGATHLVPGRHPQLGLSSPELTWNVNRVAEESGIGSFLRPVPYCLESPYLNIVRGVPRASLLSSHELHHLPNTVAFCGLLTYDGPEALATGSVARRFSRMVYITYGTACYDVRRYRVTLAAVEGLQADVLMTALHMSGNEIGSLPSNVSLRRYVANRLAFQISDLVVHHGGHGTLLGALKEGIPSVVCPDNPERTSQVDHGLTIERLGVGVYLPKEKLSAINLRKAIEDALNPTIKARALRLAGELAEDSKRHQTEFCSRLVEPLREQTTLAVEGPVQDGD